jgi:hypothetical protein
MLWALLLLAGAYSGSLAYRHRVTGIVRLDGSIGVLLGLFVCSRASGNLIDLMLFGKSTRAVGSSRASEVQWIALNLLVLAVGCAVIVGGATLFATASASQTNSLWTGNGRR